MGKSSVGLDYVGSEWLDKVYKYESYVPVLYSELEKAGVHGWMRNKFIEGWLHYQESVESDDNKQPTYSKVFPARLVDVKLVERVNKKDGKVIGTKADLIFMAKSKNGKETEQKITTGFVEYNYPDKSRYIFEMAQSKTILDIASDAIGNDVWIRKVLVPAELDEGDKIRYVGNLNVAGGNKSKEAAKSKKSAKGNDDEIVASVEDAMAILDEMTDNHEVDFAGDDVEAVEEALATFALTGDQDEAIDKLSTFDGFNHVGYVDSFDSERETVRAIILEAYSQVR